MPSSLGRVGVVLGGSAAAYLVMAVIEERRHRSRRSLYSQPALFRESGHRSVLPERAVTGTLIALNCLVYFLWKSPSLSQFMARYFVSSTRSPAITLLSSNFSHVSGWHLLANMIALYSFGGVLEQRLGSEHFLAFYISSGLLASGGSLLFRSLRGDRSGSLGASGAVFAAVAACSTDPHMRVSFLPLPFISIPISWALTACVAYDLVGLSKGWRAFDHAAHLSGVLAGYGLYKLSTQVIWPHRGTLIGHRRTGPK